MLELHKYFSFEKAAFSIAIWITVRLRIQLYFLPKLNAQ